MAWIRAISQNLVLSLRNLVCLEKFMRLYDGLGVAVEAPNTKFRSLSAIVSFCLPHRILYGLLLVLRGRRPMHVCATKIPWHLSVWVGGIEGNFFGVFGENFNSWNYQENGLRIFVEKNTTMNHPILESYKISTKGHTSRKINKLSILVRKKNIVQEWKMSHWNFLVIT